MAVLEIAALNTGEPHYTLRVQLEGADYEIDLRFSERREAWVLNMRTLDGVPIVTGQMVTPLKDLLRRSASEDRPPGVLWALNVADPGPAEGGPFARPGLYDLGPGARMRLYYTESPDPDAVADDLQPDPVLV